VIKLFCFVRGRVDFTKRRNAGKLLDLYSGVLNRLVIRSASAIATVPFECRGVPEEAGVTESTVLCKNVAHEFCAGTIGYRILGKRTRCSTSLNLLVEPLGGGLHSTRKRNNTEVQARKVT
jgi:hypothetical protein